MLDYTVQSVLENKRRKKRKEEGRREMKREKAEK